MNKSSLIQIIKHNKLIYKVFSASGKAALSLLKVFVRSRDDLILFNSFGGKKYDDSPKAIYEVMKNDPRFKGYELLWAFNDPDRFPEVENSIKSDGFGYFVSALKARCWVSNSSVQRGIDFKGKNTYSFNTWHGSAIKKMGLDSSPSFDNKIVRNNDTILAQGRHDIEVFTRAWSLPEKVFKVFGLPRNDELAHVTKERRASIRNKLGIPDGKKAILYAPTFRDYQLDSMSQVTMSLPIDYERWESILGGEWVFLLRAHYEVAKRSRLPESDMWIDVSDYASLNELMIASDLLISDYSSLIFDYSILEKPILIYAYDYDEYSEKRGVYFDIRDEFTSFEDDAAMADHIKNMDVAAEEDKARAFKAKYVEECGNAAKLSADYIYGVLTGKTSGE